MWKAPHGEIKPRGRPGGEERTWEEGLLGTPGLPTWVTELADEWLEGAEWVQTSEAVWPCGSSEISAAEEEPHGLS